MPSIQLLLAEPAHDATMSTSSVSAATLDKLAKYDTPTICNVIELFDIRPYDTGYMDERIRAAFPEMKPAVGFAATARFRSLASPGAYSTLQDQLTQFEQLPGPAFVVFQDLDVPSIGATFGEVMCSTYQGFGSVGLITSGGGRDLLQVKALDYPIFTGATICSHAYCQILDVGSPVRVGGLAVSTGDLLHGDANGVTSIPVNLAAEIADVADEYIAAESFVIQYMKSDGPKTTAEFTARRQAMGEAIAAIRRRVSRKET
jgi:regulator of RNase E activity RraA